MPTRPKLTPTLVRTLHREADRQFAQRRKVGRESKRAARAERAQKAAAGALIDRSPQKRRVAPGSSDRYREMIAWCKANAHRLGLDWHTAWTKAMAGKLALASMLAKSKPAPTEPAS